MQQTTRQLDVRESRILRSRLNREQRRLRAGPRRIFVFGFVILAVFWGLTIVATKAERVTTATVIWLAVLVPMLGWANVSARRDVLKIVNRIESALLKNEVRVIRIESQDLVDFEEVEDEGACYALQIEENRVLFVSGQDYYPSARFPNTHFSLNQILGKDDEIVEQLISKHGTKLRPTRTISARVKAGLRMPGHLALIPGRLENLELILK
jgi:hypothetical protein